MKRLIPALLILAGCTDALFGPSEDEGMSIYVDPARTPEATLLVGDRATLRVSFGRRADKNRAITWSSGNPAVADVDQGGEMLAVGPGSTRVIAAAGELADTLLVSVLSAPPVGGHCAAGSGIQLARGQAYTTTASSAATMCVKAGETGEQFILVPFNASSGGSSLQVEVDAEGISTSIFGSVAPAPPASLADPALVGPIPSAEMHRQLREREARELRPLVVRRGERLPSLATTPGPVPSVGQFITLNVNPQKSCSSPNRRSTRVAAVTERAIVLHDEANPADGFTDDEYRAIGNSFDQLVYPTLVANFGEPTDIDGNGRVLIVFTKAVNELTARDADEYIGGFFFSRDLFPRSDSQGLNGCGGSNVAEILYLMAPDPTGSVNGNPRSRYFVSQRATSLISHEFQHLISATRRLRTLGVDNWNEEFWLNEGMSHIAEELVFYAASSLGPRRELSTSTLRAGTAALSYFNQMQATNFLRLVNYLRAPHATSAIDGTDLATRGAAWAFLRYAADRSGDEPALWRRLIDSNAIGYANLGSALGVSPMTWLHDWATALYTDDQVAQVELKFRQPSWNFRSLLPTFAGVGGTYPLLINDLRPLETTHFEADLASGATSIVRFSLVARSLATLRTSSGGGDPPPELRLTLVRIR